MVKAIREFESHRFRQQFQKKHSALQKRRVLFTFLEPLTGAHPPQAPNCRQRILSVPL